MSLKKSLRTNWKNGLDFDPWDVCDQVCNLFEQTPYVYSKVVEWVGRKEEFVRRAAFALMAGLAVHDKKACDEKFEQFFPLIEQAATDDRDFVRKAVNWALRSIGKRSKALNEKAIKVAREIQKIDSRTAKWIASDALRELSNRKIQETPKSRCTSKRRRGSDGCLRGM
jgi:3-methyladenine DNA glycosylase AlkD